ncbi:MAG: pitrilysin family protein [Arenicellaceae bacterium]|nr:pitrilysin family protein [Arenicellaceae bacterium]
MSAYRILRGLTNLAVLVVTILMLFTLQTASAAPEIQVWETQHGVPVYFVEAHEIPMVQVSMGFKAGSANDPTDKLGLSSLMSQMLTMGVEGMGQDSLAEAIESTGAQIGASSDADKVVASFKSLSEAGIFQKASELFGKTLSKPTFNPDVLERERARRLVGLERQKQSPGVMAGKAYAATLFPDHPYGLPASGDESTLAAIDQSDLVAFHQKYIVQSNLVVAVVGDMTRPQVESWVDGLLASIPLGRLAGDVSVPMVPAASEQFISFDSQQSTILIGHQGIPRGHPDFIPLIVANYILGGGGLVSILADELREKRGLTYGVSSGFSRMVSSGSFTIRLQTRNDKRDEAVGLVRDVLGEFVENGPSEEQVQNAVKHLAGSFPLSTDSNSKVGRILMAIAYYGLPVDYLQTYIAELEAVDLKRVNQVVKQHMRPEDLIQVVLGGSVTEE